MTQKIDYRLPLILLGGLLFQLLFWGELLGFNLFIYTLFIFGITFTDKHIPFHKNKLYVALSHLSIAVYVVYDNSVLAIITWFVTLLVYLGTAHFTMLKSSITALGWGILQVISGPSGLIIKLRKTKLGKVNLKPVLKPMKYIVLPLVMVTIFCSLYSIANPIFAKYTQVITNHIGQFFHAIFTFLFVDISLLKCLFLSLGICITAGFIVGVDSKLLAEIEADEHDQLVRKRRDTKKPSLSQDFRTLLAGNQVRKILALKTEHIVGIISFVALNLLLLFLNAIDISTLWIKSATVIGKNFSAELHDGTNTLIFSIAIAMLIIIYFFSGNLNFYRNNKWIKLLAYLWIAQNAFLVLSVCHRDYDYILYHGLTYKRIGVAIFATLSLIGLVTVYIKVAKQKTVFFLYRINSKIWYMLLVLLSFVNWDDLILTHNLAKVNQIGVDVDHLMSFSDKTLPTLNKHRDLLMKYAILDAENERKSYNEIIEAVDSTATAVVEVQAAGVTMAPKLSEAELKAQTRKQAQDNFNQRLQNRNISFIQRQHEGSSLSFSYLKWKAAKELSKPIKQ